MSHIYIPKMQLCSLTCFTYYEQISYKSAVWSQELAEASSPMKESATLPRTRWRRFVPGWVSWSLRHSAASLPSSPSLPGTTPVSSCPRPGLVAESKSFPTSCPPLVFGKNLFLQNVRHSEALNSWHIYVYIFYMSHKVKYNLNMRCNRNADCRIKDFLLELN